MNYQSLTQEEAKREYRKLLTEYEGYKEEGLALDLSRGKPSAEQLRLGDGMLTILSGEGDCVSESGFDCRNYGQTYGLPEAKRFFSGFTGVPEELIIVCGNSSLNIMYDAVARCLLYGAGPDGRPWCREEKVKFLCPSPGYDRHFAVTESLGFELIPVEMTATGPHMDTVEELVAADPAIKGIWCVPKYSNPTGVTYSEETVRRLAAMKTAAPDFRIFWDNAYAIHAFDPADDEPLADIFACAREAGNEDRIFYFSSTSKIVFPGAGISMIAASEKNLELIKKTMAVQTIGHDKLNQLRHVRFFADEGSLRRRMAEHGAIMKRKFTCLFDGLRRGIGDTGVATFTEPKGGYFSSMDVLPGCAARVFELCLHAGVRLTQVGATFPYGRDPEDKNLRLAPSFASDAEVSKAAAVLACAAKIAALEKRV